MNSPPDLCALFNVAPGYRMIFAENMSESGGPDPKGKQATIVEGPGVMSEASMRGYVPDQSEVVR